MKPHRKAAPAEAAAAGRQEMPRCAPKADSGLSSAQAQALAEAGWDNRPVESPTKSDKQIIRENIFTYFNLIFVVLAVCLLLVGDWKDMTFLLIVAANAVIGIVQQLRSKRTIEKLSLLSAAKVRIIRDGKVRELPVDQLVREDVVELTAGCQIPADGPRPSSPARRTPSPRSLGTSCCPAASSSPASAGPGWTRWEQTPTPPS